MTVLQEIVEGIDYFPGMHPTLHRALKKIDDPDVTTDDILKDIETDITITANLLKICNSPMTPLTRKISSVREALLYVGLEELKRMILILVSKNIFNKKLSGYETEQGQVWEHSIAAAIFSTNLKQYAPEMESDLFTAVLLHDAGKIVMSDHVGYAVKEINRLLEEKGMDFLSAEEEMFQINHAEVGARILEKWNFPDEMIHAVRYHHSPDISPDHPLTHFVSIANTLAMLAGYASAIDGLSYKGYPEICKKYGIKKSHLDVIMASSLDKIKKAANFLEEENK